MKIKGKITGISEGETFRIVEIKTDGNVIFHIDDLDGMFHVGDLVSIIITMQTIPNVTP